MTNPDVAAPPSQKPRDSTAPPIQNISAIRRAVFLLAPTAYVVAMSVAAYGAQAQRPSDPKALKNPVSATKESVEQGQALFQRFCIRCHGDEGKGDGRQAPEGSHPANLTDDRWDHGSTDGEIFTTIHDGVGPKYDMDSYEGKISDTDIWNVVNYIRSIGPKAAR